MLNLNQREALDLLQSTLIVGLVFTIASKPDISDPLMIALVFVISSVAAGTGFFLHELMHKLCAQRMGYWAEYHKGQFPYMSILFAFAGWILLSPGAVYITSLRRPLSSRANGIISLAGPATNVALAVIFHAMSKTANPILQVVGGFGFEINIWLALFNMLPAPSFDGQKVWQWNRMVYLSIAVPLVAAYVVFTWF
jgi:Zn-dependent protease